MAWALALVLFFSSSLKLKMAVVGGDPTERDPTSGDLPERDATTKACVSIVTAGGETTSSRARSRDNGRVPGCLVFPRIRIYIHTMSVPHERMGVFGARTARIRATTCPPTATAWATPQRRAELHHGKMPTTLLYKYISTSAELRIHWLPTVCAGKSVPRTPFATGPALPALRSSLACR